MSPAHPQTHNRSPPSLAFSLTDVDQSCNIKLLGFAEPENYRHQLRTAYFLRRNPHYFKPLLESALLPAIRLYDLRHTAATLSLAAGVFPKVISEQLGHASVAFTLDVYSHVLPHMQDAAAERVQALLIGPTVA